MSSGEELCVVSNHDEFSLWFDVRKEAPEKRVQMPSPTAGIHLAASRNRLGQEWQFNSINRIWAIFQSIS